jgi:hypothetical protein
VLGLRGYRRSYTLRGESDRAHALEGLAALAFVGHPPVRPKARPLARSCAAVRAISLGLARSRAAVGTRALEFALAAMGVMGD